LSGRPNRFGFRDAREARQRHNARCVAIYFDATRPFADQAGFVAGRAWSFEIAGDVPDVRAELELSPNTRAALLAFGCAGRLAALAGVAPASSSLEAVLSPAALDRAVELVYAAEADTWNGTLSDDLELDAFAPPPDDGRDRRIRFDRREYQRALIRLGDLLDQARRAGHGVCLTL
jgi:hypothetical protein